MTGEEVVKAIAGLVTALGVVGGAILWIARLAAGQVLSAHKAETDRAIDDCQKEIAGLRAEIAEMRGEAKPLLRALERTMDLLEVRR